MNRRIAILVLALFTCLPTHARKCAVDDRPTAERIREARNRGQVVFYARPLFSWEDANGVSTTLLVDRSWSPGIPRIVTVLMGRWGCGYPDFQTGHSYTVFADPSNKRLSIPGCGLTREGLPEDYRVVLGPGHTPRGYDNATLWWGFGGTLWLTTFALLKVRGRRKFHG